MNNDDENGIIIGGVRYVFRGPTGFWEIFFAVLLFGIWGAAIVLLVAVIVGGFR